MRLCPISKEVFVDGDLDILAVHDEKDPTSIPKPVRERTKQLVEDQMSKCIPSSISSTGSPLNGLRIGIPKVNSC